MTATRATWACGALVRIAIVATVNEQLEVEKMDLFKNACRIHTGFAVNRYLMSNAAGRQCGAEKAQRHTELCSFYVATFFGGDPERVPAMHSEAYRAVHSATQALTDYLDERIGFPLNSRPDYEQLAPAFFEEFHSLAVDALQGHVARRQEQPEGGEK